MKPLLLRLSEH